MSSKNRTARDKRWSKLTGLSDSQIFWIAQDAALGYKDGRYSSGFEAGAAHSSVLPEGAMSKDHRIRAWGDYLIDFGEDCTL